MTNDSHPSDQELLLAADGELSAARVRWLQEHVARCETCSRRKQELETGMAVFVRVRDQDLSTRFPAAVERRAELRARLAQAQVRQQNRQTALLVASAACAVVLLGLVVGRPWFRGHPHYALVVSVPNRVLTPGLAVQASKDALCSASPSKNRLVPVPLRRQVFEEYGIQQASPQAYEVDYLITPALGGADDIRNLWPQSYSATVWNAKVKDELEDRLHDLVCQGQIDLETAQRDIAVDWVGAYKKYFHTDKPLAIQ